MTIYEIVDPGGDNTRGLLNRLGDVGRGRVVCDVLTRTRRLELLADAMLAGLGRSASLPGVPRNAQRKWDRVRAWIHAESITDVFVFPFDEVYGRLHNRLFLLSDDGPVNLWLIREVEMPASL